MKKGLALVALALLAAIALSAPVAHASYVPCVTQTPVVDTVTCHVAGPLVAWTLNQVDPLVCKPLPGCLLP